MDEEYFTQYQLVRRGWSYGMIRQYLGPADSEQHAPARYHTLRDQLIRVFPARTFRWYAQRRVLAAEELPAVGSVLVLNRLRRR